MKRWECTGCGYQGDENDDMTACTGGEIIELEPKGPKVTRKEWKKRAEAAADAYDVAIQANRNLLVEIKRLQDENDYLRSRIDWKAP